MKAKANIPCWVCGEPQDTDPDRLCIPCQCAVADMKQVDYVGGFKDTILRMRRKNE